MMRKILFLLLWMSIPVQVIAQQQDVSIHWEFAEGRVAKPASEDDKLRRDQLRTPVHLTLTKELQNFSYRWKDKGYVDKSSVAITNVTYAAASVDEINKVSTSNIPNNIQYSITSSRSRDVVYSTVSVSPLVNTNGQIKRVTSFRVSYAYRGSRFGRSSLPVTNSVLASGEWFKFKVEKTGVHQISKQFLSDLGMNTNNIDPRTIKIYSHGGKPMPLLNRLNTEFDLPENSIQVLGEEDGSFDNGDIILFYGVSVDGYSPESLDENETNLNPYSEDSYYYITAGGELGKRVTPFVPPTGVADEIINQFDDYKFHEIDEFSPAKVGRRWFGNRFDIESEQSFEFVFPNIVSSEPMRLDIKAAAASDIATSMSVSVNSTSLNPFTFSAINDPTLLVASSFEGDFPASAENVVVGMEYNNGGNPSSIGYLDYIGIEAVRRLEGVGGQLPFRNNSVGTAAGIGEYQITNAAQFSQVWDVTNQSFITAVSNESGDTAMAFKVNLGEVREYVAVNPNDYFTPVRISNSRVANQNIKGTIFQDQSGNFQDIDYLIVAPPFLLQPALRLANHHKEISGLRVKVVTTDKIYEEFSSGKQDIVAIRNLVRYIYENASSPENRIKYVNLFGDTSVDLKDRFANNNNIIPTFHSTRSTNTLNGFMSDDFYGMVWPGDEQEQGYGLVLTNDCLEIAVGRMLVDEVSLANQMVDKTINYSLKPSFGNWRNNLLLVSDDVDARFEYQDLEVTLDQIGDRITDEKPYINVKKIHTDAFQQETSAGGDRYPKVNETFVNDIELGALIVNYFGHGGEDGLAKEFIYTKETGTNLRNKNRYPCIVTVTCEFTKFDNPLRITAGELTYWNAEGGAVSLITTTRSILVSTGVTLNNDLAEFLFGFDQDIPPPPAEALRLAKNILSANDKRVAFYVGDPALTLAFPKQSVRVTTLNDEPIQQSSVVLEALSKVKLGGEVVDSQGNVITNYNGVLEAKVFDKDVQRQTLGNDGVRDSAGNLLILDFKTLGEGLFNGQATVTNGRFEFEFVVPRDIQIPVGQGKVSLYAQRNNVLEDQTGFNLDIQVGGLNENAPSDNQGPTINLFMNDLSFTSGGITNDSPILIAQLEDENGINTASGIGHDIVAILDGDETNPFVLNEYYQAEVDDFTEGTANYTLRDLEEGLHTLTLKAWDVYNNSSTAEIQFVVFGDNKLEVRRVLNYPNPFVNYTEFWFEHNRPMELLDVQVQVFTITGKVVKTINTTAMTSGGPPRDIIWDGTDDFGGKIGKGVYVYKLTVKSPLINQQVEKYEKLVIL